MFVKQEMLLKSNPVNKELNGFEHFLNADIPLRNSLHRS